MYKKEVTAIDRLNRLSCYVHIVSDLLNRYDQSSILTMTQKYNDMKEIYKIN